MDKNFAGQNLNGRSFRGQDLRGADFSDCELKSCDFTDADLTDAKFCRATLGINGQYKFTQWSNASGFLLVSGLFAWFLNVMFAYVIHEIYKSFIGIDVFVEENDTLLLIGSLYAASICISVLAMQRYWDWRIVTEYLSIISGGLALMVWVSVAVAVAGGTIAETLREGFFALAGTLAAAAGTVLGTVSGVVLGEQYRYW